MKIVSVIHLHAGCGWRNVSFIKMTTDEGLVGWAEYRSDAGNAGIKGVMQALGELMLGRDPRDVEANLALLAARTFQTAGGLSQQAIAGLGNAMLDIKAKALGVPVSALFGGPVRQRIPLYWSHCATYRVRNFDHIGVAPVRNFEDVARLGGEARQRGFKALKTSVLDFDGDKLLNFGPGFAWSPGWPSLTLDRRMIEVLQRQLAAFRDGAGPGMDIMLDLNCHFRPDGLLAIGRALEPLNLAWLEMDTRDAQALAGIRLAVRTPIASCEALYGRAALRPFLEHDAVGVVIVDVTWNGYLEAYKMAALADAYEINVAPHAYGGCLGECISAQWAASVPNLAIMEYDVDDVPWKHDLVTHPPTIEDGQFILSDRPGWGTDVNEAAVLAHPPI